MCQKRQLFVKKRPGRPLCMFGHASELASRLGDCKYHGKQCELSRLGHTDFITLGPPCAPYASQGRKPRSAAQKHSRFETLWEDFISYMLEVKPGGGILEEVQGFDHVVPGESDSAADKMVSHLSDMGYAVTKIRVNASMFFKIPRDRLHSHTNLFMNACMVVGHIFCLAP